MDTWTEPPWRSAGVNVCRTSLCLLESDQPVPFGKLGWGRARKKRSVNRGSTIKHEIRQDTLHTVIVLQKVFASKRAKYKTEVQVIEKLSRICFRVMSYFWYKLYFCIIVAHLKKFKALSKIATWNCGCREAWDQEQDRQQTRTLRGFGLNYCVKTYVYLASSFFLTCGWWCGFGGLGVRCTGLWLQLAQPVQLCSTQGQDTGSVDRLTRCRLVQSKSLSIGHLLRSMRSTKSFCKYW